MKTTINYSHLSKEEQLKKALTDAKEYLGTRKFDLLTFEVRKTYLEKGIRVAIHKARFLCAFVGIEGLPVKAIIKHCVRKED